MDYPVFRGQTQLGKVQLRKEGLYYCVSCRCHRPGDMIYRLAATVDGSRKSLGILVPMGDGLGLEKKIPISHLGQGSMDFFVLPTHEPLEGRFVPLSPKEPFAYLQDLKDACLAEQDGQVGVMLPPAHS